jgi:DNA-binding NarL/FixJ family response regulator
LTVILQSDPTVEVVDADVDGPALTNAISRLAPQAVIIGENIEPAVITQLSATRGALGVLVFTAAPTPLTTGLLTNIGVICVASTASAAEIVQALHLAARGSPVSTDDSRHPQPRNALTPRQNEVFRLLSQGKTNPEIAFALHMGYETVRTHVREICRRLTVRTRQDLIGMTLLDDDLLQ